MRVRRLLPVVAGILAVLAASPVFAAGRGNPAPPAAPTPTLAPVIPNPWAGKTSPAATQTDPVKAAAEERAAMLFQEKFGQAWATIRATKETGDDVALAAGILAAARSQGIDDTYRAYLCTKAMELGLVDPKGYETVVNAAMLLATVAPEKADACNDTIINIRQSQYALAARGDEKLRLGVSLFDTLMASGASKTDLGNLQDAMRRYQQAAALAKSINHPGAFDAEQQLAVLVEKARVAQRVSQLANLLKVDPNNHLAGDQMLLAQLVDCDNPAEAVKYLRDDADAGLRKYVPASAKGIDAAPELACVELAEWYYRLAAEAAATTPAKLAMLHRSDGYYHRFLALHVTEDPQRADVDQAAKKVEADIDRLASTTAGPPWNDCLKLADPARDVLSGTWQKTDAGLAVSDDGPGKLALRLLPQGTYELEVKFIRDHGDMVGVALPVGSNGFLASLGGRGSTTGGADSGILRFVRPNPGRPDPSNPAIIGPSAVADGDLHTAVIRVQVILEQATITMTLDGKPLPKWTGPVKSLNSGEFSPALPQRVWLVTNRAQVTFTGVRLRVLNGQAAPVASIGIPAAPAVPAVNIPAPAASIH